jgi:hypothetical protein
MTTLPPLPSSKVDLDTGTILGNLGLAFMAVAEIRKGRWGAFGDIAYSRLSMEADSSFGLLYSGINVKSSNLILSFLAGPIGPSPQPADSWMSWLGDVIGRSTRNWNSKAFSSRIESRNIPRIGWTRLLASRDAWNWGGDSFYQAGETWEVSARLRNSVTMFTGGLDTRSTKRWAQPLVTGCCTWTTSTTDSSTT